jgi:hypothetical protein
MIQLQSVADMHREPRQILARILHDCGRLIAIHTDVFEMRRKAVQHEVRVSTKMVLDGRLNRLRGVLSCASRGGQDSNDCQNKRRSRYVVLFEDHFSP